MTFKNKKPTLFGNSEDSIAIIDVPAVATLTGDNIDTHAADLTGEVDGLTPVNQLGYPTPIGGGGTAVINNFVETIYASSTLNATEAVNVGFIRKSNGIDTAGSITTTTRIREDDLNGNILASSSTSSTFFTIIQQAIIKNQPIGNRTYVFTIQLTNTNTGDFYRFHTDATSLAYIVDIDDTHIATLSGDNTDTHAASITTPATAIKQINVPESHNTKAGVSQ